MKRRKETPMNYIVFDLEFNQDLSSLQDTNMLKWQTDSPVQNKKGLSQYPFEIIQIGAVKLDSNLNNIATYNQYIKPVIYSNVSPFVTELTGITTEQLSEEKLFPLVYDSFIEFIGEAESVFCIWGMSDLKALYKNVDYHKLNSRQIPELFINIQPFVPKHLKLTQKNLLRLQTAVELLEIPITYEFHNALHDAYYTAEILKKIYSTSIQPRPYNPSYVFIRPKQQKKTIQYDKLIQQFEKMYAREMTDEEQDIIKLAYKMGKTRQFIE